MDTVAVLLHSIIVYIRWPGDTAQDWHYGRANNGIGGSGDAGPATSEDNADKWEKNYFANATAYLQYSLADGLILKQFLVPILNSNIIIKD